MVVNFKKNPPEFSTPSKIGEVINTKSPDEVFKGKIMFDMKCSCTTPNCKHRMTFYYPGLTYYCGLKNLSDETKINIMPPYSTEPGQVKNVIWDPVEEDVDAFVAFSKTIREAIVFKRELLKGLFALLQVRIKGYHETHIIVRKEENEIRFILFEIPNAFSNVPLLRESTGYRECLGIITTLPIDTDTSKIENEHANMADPFFEPVITWVKSLGEVNQLDITIDNIWVMPE
jgi:hypothetical protein